MPEAVLDAYLGRGGGAVLEAVLGRPGGPLMWCRSEPITGSSGAATGAITCLSGTARWC
ncbi:hypothetical protein ACQEVF_41290 [Nonomuraea polychroma]|uniref:hypothetical protein n=1 Tax=Nonomuraea polychroma TaxID=46176 RepID=UPI003D8C8E3F